MKFLFRQTKYRWWFLIILIRLILKFRRPLLSKIILSVRYLMFAFLFPLTNRLTSWLDVRVLRNVQFRE